MSLPREVKFKCQNCGKTYEGMIWDTVNSMITPEMKPHVMDLSIFTKTCPHCHEENPVLYPILYHQMEDKFMVQFMQDNRISDFMSNLPDNVNPWKLSQDDGYYIRIANDPYSFAEKIMLFDNKMDDRAVELVKFALLRRVVHEEKDPEAFFDHQIDIITMLENADAAPDSDERYKFYVMLDGEPYITAPLVMDMYKDFKKDVDNVFGPIESDRSTNINLSWAMKAINPIAEAKCNGGSDTDKNSKEDDEDKDGE